MNEQTLETVNGPPKPCQYFAKFLEGLLSLTSMVGAARTHDAFETESLPSTIEAHAVPAEKHHFATTMYQGKASSDTTIIKLFCLLPCYLFDHRTSYSSFIVVDVGWAPRLVDNVPTATWNEAEARSEEIDLWKSTRFCWSLPHNERAIARKTTRIHFQERAFVD
jgi:hypothetical protein